MNRSNQEFHIREIEPTDLARICTLCAEHAAYEGSVYSFDGKEQALHKLLFGEPKQIYGLVALINGFIVGYATYTIDFSTWEARPYLHLDCLYLIQEARGRGVGKALIQQVANMGLLHGCTQMQWQTPVENRNAIEFYQHLGALGLEKVRFFMTTENL